MSARITFTKGGRRLGSPVAVLLLGALSMSGFSAPARAETTNEWGSGYASLCLSRGVPLPPKWGGSSQGNWTFNGSFSELYPPDANGDTFWDTYNGGNGDGGGNIYYHVAANPPGICVIVAHTLQLQFDVICQGANGKACFWESEMTHQVPFQAKVLADTNPFTPDYVLGGTSLVGRAEPCTNCHAGHNAFITHFGGNSLHATNLSSKSWWTPNNWFEAIVPTGWAQNPGPGNFTNAPASTSNCLGCHNAANKNSLPAMSAATAGYCKILLWHVSNRPPSRTGMPPFGIPCIASMNCARDTDPFVQYIESSMCP